MKFFYEKLVNPIEQVYYGKSTLEKKITISDIIKNYLNEVYVQYKNKINKQITYEYSDININGIIPTRNSQYFYKQHTNKVLGYLDIKNGVDNILRVEVVNNHPTASNPYKIKLLFNGVEIETIEYDDLYIINNYKYVNFKSNVLDTNIKITWPLFLNNGEFVEYKVYNISLNDNILNKYMAIYDSMNKNIIFDRDYKENEIYIVLQSYGGILRGDTINELYRLNANSFVLFDDARDTLTIPVNHIIKMGDLLKFIKAQTITIDPSTLQVGYNLLGLYLHDDHQLTYDIILSNVSYATLINNIDNYVFDLERKDRQYVGYIIGLNNITDFVPIDLFLYNIGFGGGSGGGNANKINIDFTDVSTIDIVYGAGSATAPIVQVFAYVDGDFQLIEPQEVKYNLNDTIHIEIGDILTGKVEVI